MGHQTDEKIVFSAIQRNEEYNRDQYMKHGLIDALRVDHVDIITKEIEMSRTHKTITSIIPWTRDHEYALKFW